MNILKYKIINSLVIFDRKYSIFCMNLQNISYLFNFSRIKYLLSMIGQRSYCRKFKYSTLRNQIVEKFKFKKSENRKRLRLLEWQIFALFRKRREDNFRNKFVLRGRFWLSNRQVGLAPKGTLGVFEKEERHLAYHSIGGNWYRWGTLTSNLNGVNDISVETEIQG